jgi:hypothetical protein
MVNVKKPVLTGDIKEAQAVAEGYTVVISPSGAKTTVPDSILQVLLDSGYKAAK